jgi:hypothetical protein
MRKQPQFIVAKALAAMAVWGRPDAPWPSVGPTGDRCAFGVGARSSSLVIDGLLIPVAAATILSVSAAREF